jgi:(S)-2-hydroxyglutarate dehydrogenase
VQRVDVLVVGGGIVGTAVARQYALTHPAARVTVLEKETRVAGHQTGHNSGVIHSGVYYKPGSLKARLCVAGARAMVEFCREHGVPVEVPGKLIVATEPEELPRLRAIADRAQANGVPTEWLEPPQAKECEPNVACLAALRVPSTGITDYAAVTATYAEHVKAAGGEVVLGAKVTGIREVGGRTVVESSAGAYETGLLVNCAGLYADRIAALAGVALPARIIAFRGEYFTVRRTDLVKGLVYPVADPALPFLGVHLTRMVDGSLHAGPNAVLALAREGYSWGRISARDLARVAGYPGAWRLFRRHLGTGVTEVRRSLSRRRFAASLARLAPGITVADLEPAPAGVRAQAVGPDGALLDDFTILRRPGQVHVLNAPSPAATSSLEIARYLVDEALS